MILPTMTPEEKVRQMEKMKPLLNEVVMGWMKRNHKIVFKTKVFPTFYTFERTFEGMGKWTVIVEAESKAVLKKGIINVRCYQTYVVSHAKLKSNNGMGIYLLNVHNEDIIMCNELPPHYFNQFRKRFVEARGLAQPDFPNLVKMVLREHHDSVDETVTDLKIKLDDEDRMYFEENEEYNRQAGFKNLITYSRNGISLGLSGANRRYFNLTTFVSNEMLKDNQVEAQKENLKHQLNYRHKADLDPFAPKENIFEFVDPTTRGYGLNKKSKLTDK